MNSPREALEGELPVTLERAAALAGVTEKTIRSWIDAGLQVLQHGKQGRGAVKTLIDLAELVRWITDSENALDVAKTRLASAQADKHEMENALRRGELADVKDVERAWLDMVLAFRSKILSMPAKLAAQLTNISDAAVIATRIRTEASAALTELATDEPRRSGSEASGAKRSKSRKTAARTHRKPVGRRQPQTQ